MNKAILLGRICNDLELKQTGDNKYTKFSLAINRKQTDDDGNRKADFINCIAWNKTAEIISEYFKKGSRICITGRIQTGSYENKDKTKIHTTDIVVESFEFIDKKEENTQKNEKDAFEEFGEEVELDDFQLPF